MKLNNYKSEEYMRYDRGREQKRRDMVEGFNVAATILIVIALFSIAYYQF